MYGVRLTKSVRERNTQDVRINELLLGVIMISPRTDLHLPYLPNVYD